MNYLLLKHTHVALAVVSVAGFVLRWAWSMRGNPLAMHRLTRTLPHVVDAAFLATGIALAGMLSANPLEQSWLMAKLIGLVAYIVLASLAYKRVESRRARVALFVAALLVFTWVISVARLKTPLGFLGLITA